MDEFTSLDILLMLSGCRINVKTRACKIVNLLFRMLIVSSYIFTTIVPIVSMDLEAEILSSATFYSDAFSGAIFMYIIIQNQPQMIGILREASASLTREQKHALRRYSRCCLIFIIVYDLQEIPTLTLHLIGMKWDHILLDSIRMYTRMNIWFVGGSCIYIFFVKVIRFREELFSQKVQRVMATDQFAYSDIMSLIYERQKLSAFRDSILHSFSLIPCLWFANIFLKIAMMFEQARFKGRLLIFAIHAIENIVLVGSLLRIIHHCEKTATLVKT